MQEKQIGFAQTRGDHHEKIPDRNTKPPRRAATGKFGSGDVVLSNTCYKYLPCSESNDNKTQTAPYQAENYEGFDLYRTGQCP